MKATADNRKIETTDVLVVSGGLAGLAAAVVSATAGAETTLLEQAAVLGGNVTQAYVYSFYGLYQAPSSADLEYTNPGFASWFAMGLARAGGTRVPEVLGRIAVLPIWPPRLAALCRCTVQPLAYRYSCTPVWSGWNRRRSMILL